MFSYKQINNGGFCMAVPKRKTSCSKRGSRRSANSKISHPNVVIDKLTGNYVLSHHISSSDGTYKGRSVLQRKENKKESESTD